MTNAATGDESLACVEKHHEEDHGDNGFLNCSSDNDCPLDGHKCAFPWDLMQDNKKRLRRRKLFGNAPNFKGK